MFSTTLITSFVLYAVPPFWGVPILQSLGRHQLECEVKLLKVLSYSGDDLRHFYINLLIHHHCMIEIQIIDSLKIICKLMFQILKHYFEIQNKLVQFNN